MQDHLCVYCQHSRAESIDHVPPRGLFPSPLPGPVATVPACKDCNLGFAQDDEYFRTIVLLNHTVADHPVAATVLPRIYRSLQRTQARAFSRRLRAGIEDIDMYTPAGLYLGTGGRFPVDWPRVEKTIVRISMGLLYWRNRSLPPLAHRYRAGQLWAGNAALDRKIEPLIAGQPVQSLAGGNFAYVLRSAEDSPSSSVCTMTFYGALSFVALIVSPHPRSPTAG